MYYIGLATPGLISVWSLTAQLSGGSEVLRVKALA
jgi:hypothetical protein